jgi:hypothetical protein
VWSPNVGAILFEDLAPDEVRIVSLTWTPGEPGHHGLHTVIEAEGDPADHSAPCSPHRPRWDNNVSWRNVVVYKRPPHSALGLAAPQQATVELVNVYQQAKAIDLVIQRAGFPPEGTLTIQLSPALFDRWQASEGRWGQGIVVFTSTREIVVTGEISATVGGIPLAPLEESLATLLFDAPETGVFEVALQGYIDGVVAGGVSYHWTVDDLTPPEVVAHGPAADAVDVALDAPIVVTFSEVIGPLTFDPALEPAVTLSSLTWNAAGTVVTLTHSGLRPATHYTVTLVASDGSANALESPYTWSFTTRPRWFMHLPYVQKQ